MLNRPAGLRACLMAACLAGVLLPCSAFSAEDAAQKAAELGELRDRIKKLQTSLQSNRARKSQAEKELRAVEKRIGDVTRALRKLDRQLAASRSRLKRLDGEQAAARARLDVQSDQLAREARAAYAMGRQQQVKLLLNQEEPATMGRMQAYFGYFSRARSARITEMRATLESLDTLAKQIEGENQALADLQAEQQANKAELQSEKKTRAAAIERLARQLLDQGGELERLKGDEKQLQALVHSLQELLSDIPADATPHKPFKALKGQLRWPARGRLAKRFGARRGQSGLKWQGVVIEAPEGGAVRAVSQGRVAFADWLRGFGLLLIIDHGDGYMSLYGQNQALYKEVGEWVDSGEVVATLGASGGRSVSGLYFELRHNGRPVNPVRWCTGKPGGGRG